MKFSTTYLCLGDTFFQRALPQKVVSPTLLLWNTRLATSLSIANEWQKDKNLLAQYFSGSKLPLGADPIALAYSGHQFGHFNPQLGDGRAHLLGEVIDNNGVRQDIQLKGSGQTKFSRRGDGKCALAPALREYIMSEALHALGVPTTRCLSVVATGEIIHRGIAQHGAVVTRSASSHLRIGTFQYFAVFGEISSLKKLLDYTIKRHFPEFNQLRVEDNLTFDEVILGFLEQVLNKQITLIIQWLRIGFIHGVMNTDNTTISGETIDFGPCAMMGRYDKNAVFSSIDEYGRYAFGKQGQVAQWNVARLADCLLPLLVEFYAQQEQSDHCEKILKAKAVIKVQSIVHQYSQKFDKAYYTMYAHKLGFGEVMSNDLSIKVNSLTDELLEIMQNQGLDYTQTFHALTVSLIQNIQGEHFSQQLSAELDRWYQTWHSLLAEVHQGGSHPYCQLAHRVMVKVNPVVIPRNHHVEALLARCEQVVSQQVPESHYEGVNHILAEFIKVINSPYLEFEATKKYQDTPLDGDKSYQTFCGT
ncbi:MAG: YdiU family protein [Litorilituus sp.]|nr:YdiU family protein [Litorilituus sp.]